MDAASFVFACCDDDVELNHNRQPLHKSKRNFVVFELVRVWRYSFTTTTAGVDKRGSDHIGRELIWHSSLSNCEAFENYTLNLSRSVIHNYSFRHCTEWRYPIWHSLHQISNEWLDCNVQIVSVKPILSARFSDTLGTVCSDAKGRPSYRDYMPCGKLFNWMKIASLRSNNSNFWLKWKI